MISRTSVTYEMDDLTAAASELARGVLTANPLKNNSVGMLFCYSDMDIGALAAALEPALPFEVIGCSCIASMDEKEGFREMAARLVVLSADDCAFSVGLSEAIAPGNVMEHVEATYRKAVDALPETPRLLYVIAPYNLNIMLDEFTMALNGVAEGIPVIGGLPSYNANGDDNMTIFGGKTFEDRMVLLAISGNIRPVFRVQNVAGSAIERKRRVTAARDNTVYRVGNQTFTEYMTDIGFPMERLTGGNDTVTFVANPILLENVSMGGGDDFSFVRTLHKIDLAEGSGTAIGRIPEGATLSICSLEKGDIEKAAGIGMRALKAQMRAQEAEGYSFSTVLAVSCIGRYVLMLPEGETETRELLAELPGGVAMAGFYGYGEIGPLPLGQDGMMNFAHNESLVLCAF